MYVVATNIPPYHKFTEYVTYGLYCFLSLVRIRIYLSDKKKSISQNGLRAYGSGPAVDRPSLDPDLLSLTGNSLKIRESYETAHAPKKEKKSVESYTVRCYLSQYDVRGFYFRGAKSSICEYKRGC